MTRTLVNLVHVARGSVRLLPFLVLVTAFALAQGLAFLALIPVVDAVVRGEDGGLNGGFGGARREALAPTPVVCLGVPKEFPAHGDRDDMIARFGYDAAGIERAARVALGRLAPQKAGV